MNPLKMLQAEGQSVWLDFIHRDLLGAPLDKLIKEDGLKGIGLGVPEGENIADNGRSERVFGYRLLPRAEELVSGSRCLFEHAHFKKKID